MKEPLTISLDLTGEERERVEKIIERKEQPITMDAIYREVYVCFFKGLRLVEEGR